MATSDSDIKPVIQPDDKDRSGLVSVKLVVVVVVLCMLVSVIAIALAAASISQNGQSSVVVNSATGAGQSAGSTASSNSAEIWTFAIGHDGTNIEYIDEVSGTLRGFHVDIVNAVCAQANKDCRLVWDVYENCWNSQAGQRARGGTGILANWYDACTGWFNTYERALTVQFSREFRKGLNGVFYVRSGNPGGFDPTSITSTQKIGFIDGWASDEHCIGRNSGTISGVPLDLTTQVIHYGTREELLDAVNNNEVSAAFANSNVYAGGELEVIGNPITNCARGGGSIMSRKDSTLNSWWDPAFEAIRSSSVYSEICDKVTTDHGHQPGASGDLLCVD